MTQDNSFSLKFLFNQSQSASTGVPTTIHQVTGINVPGAQAGLNNLARTPGFLNKVKAAGSALKSSFDSDKNGSVDARGFWNQLTNRAGVVGIAADALSNVQAPTQQAPAQYQPAPQTPYSSLMNGFSLDTFLQGIPQIGANFYNTPQYSPSTALQTPQYGQLPDLSTNAWYTGTGAGSMGPVPAAPQAGQPQPQAPQQAPQTRPTPDKMPVVNWQSAPSMSLADYNALNMKGEAARLVNDPNSRSVGYTTIAQRFDPLAGHYAHVQKMDMAKYAGDLSPSKSLEDAQFNQEMARKLANLSQ
jgi:hypothetical protein